MRISKTLEGLLHHCVKNEETGCLEWPFSRMRKGYGRVRDGIHMVLVHRKVYQLSHPDENIEGLDIRHTCDNPPCCNPEHLISGTHQENMDDMRSKKREFKPGPKNPPKGEDNVNTKLSDEQVFEIRKMRAENKMTLKKLSDIFGVSFQHVSRIINNKRRDSNS